MCRPQSSDQRPASAARDATSRLSDFLPGKINKTTLQQWISSNMWNQELSRAVTDAAPGAEVTQCCLGPDSLNW